MPMFGRVHKHESLPSTKGKISFPGGADIDGMRDRAGNGFFKKKIKAQGKMDLSFLPYRKPDSAIDTKYGPGDKVC